MCVVCCVLYILVDVMCCWLFVRCCWLGVVCGIVLFCVVCRVFVWCCGLLRVGRCLLRVACMLLLVV